MTLTREQTMGRVRFFLAAAKGTLLTGCLLVALAGGGCDAITTPEIPDALSPALAPHRLIGEDAFGQSLFAVRQEPYPPEDEETPGPPLYDIYSVDPATFAHTLVRGDIQAFAIHIRGNGRWIAWSDWLSHSVYLYNAETEETMTVLAGEEGVVTWPSVAALTAGRLVVHRGVAQGDDGQPTAYELRVYELLSALGEGAGEVDPEDAPVDEVADEDAPADESPADDDSAEGDADDELGGPDGLKARKQADDDAGDDTPLDELPEEFTPELSQVVGDVWSYDIATLVGDTLIFCTDEGVEVSVVGGEVGAHLESVDLVTGRRERVASNLRLPSDGGLLEADGGAVYWQQYLSGGFEVRVRRYDPVTEALTTVVNPLDTEAETALAVDLSLERLLVERVFGSATEGLTIQYDIRALDGRAAALATFYNSVDNPFLYEIAPRFAGNFVVWTDPFDGDLVVKDPATDQVRRVVPSTWSAED
jgi:hypothetical protein